MLQPCAEALLRATTEVVLCVTAAHIHEAAAGTNGSIVVNLAAPADGNATDCLTEGETGKFVGDQTVAEILANPSDYYVNVHNAEYRAGDRVRPQTSTAGWVDDL